MPPKVGTLTQDRSFPRKREGIRGLVVSHDHGDNFMTDYLQQQIRFSDISASHAFVIGPETDSVIERLFQTMKEQAIHGRVFRTVDEIRDTVRYFAARYKAEWLIEKNGFRSPLNARAVRVDTNLRRAK